MVAAIDHRYDGPLNIVGPGAATPWQAVRLGGRVPLPVVGPMWGGGGEDRRARGCRDRAARHRAAAPRPHRRRQSRRRSARPRRVCTRRRTCCATCSSGPTSSRSRRAERPWRDRTRAVCATTGSEVDQIDERGAVRNRAAPAPRRPLSDRPVRLRPAARRFRDAAVQRRVARRGHRRREPPEERSRGARREPRLRRLRAGRARHRRTPRGANAGCASSVRPRCPRWAGSRGASARSARARPTCRACLRDGHLVAVPLAPTWLRSGAGVPPRQLMLAMTHAPIVPVAVTPGGPFGLALRPWRVRFGSLVTLRRSLRPRRPARGGPLRRSRCATRSRTCSRKRAPDATYAVT